MIPLEERTAGLPEQLIGMSPADWDTPDYEPLVTVHVDGQPVQARCGLLPRRGEQPVTTVTVSVQLTVRDVVVILARYAYDEEPVGLSAEHVRECVAQAVLNAGCMGIEEWRSDPRERWWGDEPDPDHEAELIARVGELLDGGRLA